MSGHGSKLESVGKRDWVPTGRIDFATQLYGKPEEVDQPSEFKLLVEERRIVESVTGSENLEIQWRLATLMEAKAIVAQYHKYLSEHSLIKSIADETMMIACSKYGLTAPSGPFHLGETQIREPQESEKNAR